MLSIRSNIDEVKKFLPSTLSIAAVNADKLCVVSGCTREIEEFSKVMDQKDIPNKLLATSHAFHSSMMTPVLDTFKDEVEKTQLNPPRLRMVSTVTGQWLKDVEAVDPQYWTDHLRKTVQFADASKTILSLKNPILLEVGPGRTLVTLVRQRKEGRSATALASLPAPKNNEGAYPALLNVLGELWLNGLEPDWKAFYKGQLRKKVRLPGYVFDRRPCWVEPLSEQRPMLSALPSLQIEEEEFNENTNQTKPMRKTVILQKISEIIDNASGIDVEGDDYNLSFLELGLDSLILTQFALTCKKEFGTPITFRQLNEDFNSPERLASYLDESLPEDQFAPPAASQNIEYTTNPLQSPAVNGNFVQTENQNSALGLISQQIQLLGKQIELLQGSGQPEAPKPLMAAQANGVEQHVAKTNTEEDTRTAEEKKEHGKPFGASPKIDRSATGMDAKQETFLQELTKRYNKKTEGSKTYTQKHRSKMSDPRVVSGFKPLTKELVYPLVIQKSSGNRLWDLDGNEYIDALNGFGSCIFGHQPDFIKEALKKQVDLGYEVGPQHPLAGEVCELLCEFTGHDRAALCNTGSEAVLGTMRIARTVTGRSLIVAFTGSYHGINDEALVRGSKKLRTFPAAPGIMPKSVENMLILDYGTEESLNIIKERAHELAAVLIEPVQSRRPEFQPLEFLREVREITEKSKTALIFDEVITGFRSHPGGAQALFGIKADLATYGKVFGGGLPIGAILGKKEYMDALDGGFWQFGDDSFPEVGVTYFAGTFVRHPLALAATKASLMYMKQRGPDLQTRLNTMTENLARELNLEFLNRGLPMEINHFSSLWRLKFKEEVPYSELLFVLMREKGVHIWDGFPCFLTEPYSEEDIAFLIKSFIESIEELTAVGIFEAKPTTQSRSNGKKTSLADLNKPPIPGARMGRDESGNPAWYIADKTKEGKYVKIEL